MGMDQHSTLSVSLAEQLRAERSVARLSRAQLASASGVSAKTIQRLEEGERLMNTDQMARLCAALGVTLVEFVSRASDRLASRPDPAYRDAL